MTSFFSATLRSWVPVLCLGFAAFLFVSTEVMPIGLLPDIAISLGQTEPRTGLVVTVYAWCVACATVPLTIWTQRVDRRKLFLLLLAGFIICHGVAAWAPNFTTLMVARFFSAFSHALFWAIATPLAARLAPKGAQARAVAFMITSGSLGTVLGMPLGALLGHWVGWRIVFAAVGFTGVLVFLAMARWMPSASSTNTNNSKSFVVLLTTPKIALMYCTVVMLASGHFTLFSYLVPFFQQLGAYSEGVIVFLLFVLGMSGVLGAMLASRYAERRAVQVMLLALAAMTGSMVLAPSLVSHVLAIVLLCFTWGAGLAGVKVGLQVSILREAAHASDMGIALYSAIFNVGIGSGAFIGSIVFAKLGIETVAFAGVILLLCAMVIIAFSSYRYR